MAQFVSCRGKFYPAIEEVSLVYNGEKDIPKDKLSKYVTVAGDVLKKGMPYIYKGPDREAMAMLKKEDVEFLGQDFEHDVEFLQKIRTLNFNTVEEYLKFIGYDKKKDEDRFARICQEVKRHELPEEGEEALIIGGGQDKANSDNDIIGGFGEPKMRPRAEVKMSK
jgi:hypothetical protein